MRVKNDSGSSQVWVGQTIADQAEYDIPSQDIFRWRSDDKVIQDLSSLDLLIGDGSTYKTTSSDAVNFLLGILPTGVIVKADDEIVNASVSLKVSQSVPAGNIVADTYIVPNGQTASVKLFQSSCPESPLAVCMLIWDYGGGGESIEWVFQRQGEMPREAMFSFSGDGVKKIAVVCDNGCLNDYYFNAFAKIEVS